MLNDTIVAISTAVSDGAVSIIRLSGDEAIDIVNKIFSKDLSKVESNTINYGFIMENDEAIDEVLVSVFSKGRSYTKEDVVEINTHGGYYITKKVLGLTLAHGARLAEAGEFTRRAFLNGRIDMTQAESINDLINAQDENNAKLAIKGIRGSLKKLILPLIDDVLDIVANIEVNIDYPEYDDVEMLTNETVKPKALALLSRIDEIIKRANNTRLIKEGLKTAIVGKPNVGKSSLLNALLEEDKAIVTDIAGTTRDIVEGLVKLDNISLHLFDTAGIRETDNLVEKLGIDKSLETLDQADLIIFIVDNSSELAEEDKILFEKVKNLNTILAFNKTDLANKNQIEFENSVSISAKNGDIESLIKRINDMYEKYQDLIDQPSLNNERQIACLKRAKNELLYAIEAMDMGYELDLVTVNLQEVFNSLKEILGKRNKDDLLDTLFANFCLGK